MTTKRQPDYLFSAGEMIAACIISVAGGMLLVLAIQYMLYLAGA